MAARTTRVVVCEGKDDLAALRFVLRSLGCTDEPKQAVSTGRLVFKNADIDLDVVAADSKSQLARRANQLASGTASARPDAIAVCYDPDDDRSFEFFTREFNRLAAGRDHRTITIVEAPWRSGDAPSFDNSPLDHHSLERVLIKGILGSACDRKLVDWAANATSDLQRIVQDHGWKRAFRALNAALHPGTDSFVDRLLQDAASKDSCLAALLASEAADGLRKLLAVAPAVTDGSGP